MADRTYFLLRPAPGARPFDDESARRLARIAGASFSEVGADGVARLGFEAATDASTARGNLQMAARIELGAHWQTRYDLEGS